MRRIFTGCYVDYAHGGVSWRSYRHAPDLCRRTADGRVADNARPCRHCGRQYPQRLHRRHSHDRSGSACQRKRIPNRQYFRYGIEKTLYSGAYIFAAVVLLFSLGHDMDVLALEDETASSLGMNTKKYRFLLLLCAAMLSGASVSFSGLLGFVA
jgi:hypothetical protein